MIIINYWTSPHYEMNVGDKFYCADIEVALRVVNEELNKEWLQSIDELSNNIAIEMNNWDTRYIFIDEEYLIT